MNQGPYHIERLEFVIIPEPSTVLAGLETGEIDYAGVQASDVAHLRTLDHLTILEAPWQGMYPALHINMGKAPFDDIRVRQALNHALDRQLLVDVILEGHGRPQYGPLSSTIGGYWEGVEEIGYRYDPERAQALLAEAGFADGLELEFKCLTPSFNTLCEVIQQLFSDVGITAEIVLVDASVFFGDALAGNYDVMTLGYGARRIRYPLSLVPHQPRGRPQPLARCRSRVGPHPRSHPQRYRQPRYVGGRGAAPPRRASLRRSRSTAR